jgi:hypothetical protein
VDTQKAVDKFYARLEETREDQRHFSQFASDYQDIEVQIRTLILRTELQAHDEKGTDMANTLLDLWKKKAARHKASDQYSEDIAEVDQKILDGLLTSMALALQNLKGDSKP